MIDEFLPVSPVPSDAELIGNQLPFTAFGQKGEGNMDLRVFEQGVYWVNVEGEPFYIARMERNYVLNVLKFLMENVEYFHAGVCRDADIDILIDPIMRGREAAVVAKMREGRSVFDLTPDAWLRGTPLARALFKAAWPDGMRGPA